MRWFIADTHFGHAKVIEYDNRPFANVEEMNKQIIERWNNVVKPTDTVYHLGDFAFLPNVLQEDVLSKLNGTKILIRGNHDKSREACQRIGWDFVCDGILMSVEGLNFICIHDPSRIHTSDFVLHGHTHKDCGRPNWLCVSCNLWDHTPISEKALAKEIRKKIKEQNDWGNPLTP